MKGPYGPEHLGGDNRRFVQWKGGIAKPAQQAMPSMGSDSVIPSIQAYELDL